MKYAVIKLKEMKKILKRNGYTLNRQNGDHLIYTKKSVNHISINLSLNPMVARRLIRENHLIVEE